MSQKFFKISLLLGFILSSILSLCAQKSDRESSGLKGFVQSVKEYSAEINFKDGKPVEGRRELDSLKTFDVAGKSGTYYIYTDGGEILYGDTLIYDSSDKLIEKRTVHSKFTYLCDKYVYTYDQAGRLFEETCHVTGRGSIGKYINRYDDAGKLIERERVPIVVDKLYFGENTLERFVYNNQGQLTESSKFVKENGEWKPKNLSTGELKRVDFSNDRTRVSTVLKYDAAGVLKLIEVSSDDDSGNEIETVEYFPDGSVKGGNRYEYQFDKQGNAIKEIDYAWVTEDGKSSFRASGVTYREITYFSAAEIKKFETSIKSSPSKNDLETNPNKNNDKGEYAVYEALLTDWNRSPGIKSIVLGRFTKYPSFGDDNADTPLSFDGVEKEVLEDFNAKNRRKSFELSKNLFSVDNKIVLINESEMNEIFSDHNAGWKFFYEKYPESQGITTLSRVGFNSDKTKALVYFGTQSDWLAGAGYLVILQKDAKNWKIIKKSICWIS